VIFLFPGVNKRQMELAMRKMGIQQQELDAVEVIIRLKDKEIVISEPNVSKVNMMGQYTYQVVGKETTRPLFIPSSEIEINEEDIKTVIEQTGVDYNTAKDAIKKHKGDLAEAIMELKE